MNKVENAKKIAAVLDWYHMNGVETIFGEQTTDWFEVAKNPPVQFAPARPRPTAPRSKGPLTASPQRRAPNQAPKQAPKQAHADHTKAAAIPAQAVLEAREISAKAQNLEELRSALTAFDGCSLKKMAKNMCFADGNPQSPLMLVGEAPGRDEDLAGVPFVGRAGQLLNKMLAAVELSRQEDVWITNTVYWRPPGNRNPTISETEICRPFLERSIELIKPKIIVALGGPAAKNLLSTKSGIMRLRGKWHEVDIGGQSVQIMPTLHPAYLLRTPAAKKLAWHDLLMIRQKLRVHKEE
ncbi:MAG: uracil-DNA glycosylase [Hyphomicrobiaceae bacterium]|nr:uracil-DNA glycosylase [Hyphomicrobiaceae bacterium]